jgi:hypothetical protein
VKLDRREVKAGEVDAVERVEMAKRVSREITLNMAGQLFVVWVRWDGKGKAEVATWRNSF